MKRILLILFLALTAALLSGCSSAGRGVSWPGLAVSGDVAYLADGAAVYAVNLKDGQEIWRYPAKSSAAIVFYSTPVITDDGLVIVGSAGTDYTIHAINPKDIDPETNSPMDAWTFKAQDHWIASPIIVENKLFAPNADGNVYVLDLKDNQTFKKPVETIQFGSKLWGTPATDGKRVFVTSLEHSIYGIDIATYKYWQQDLGGAAPGTLAIGSDGMIYVGSFASQLERIDPATGERKDVIATSGWVWGAPLLDGDNLYFGDSTGKFYSWNIKSSSLNWDPIQPSAEGPITASPILVNDKILAATEAGAVYEIDRTGQAKLWAEPGGNIYTTPVIAGDKILVAPLGAEEYLYAYNLTGGLPAWSFLPK